MSKHVGSFKIKHSRPWLCPLFILLAIIATIALSWYFYPTLLQKHTKSCQQAQQNLEAENAKLQQRSQIFVRAAQVDQEMLEEMRASLREQRNQIILLNQKSDFYQQLATEEIDALTKVIVKSFQIDNEEDDYIYHLTLTQLAQKPEEVKGKITLAITGTEHHQEKKFVMEKITPDEISTQAYQFTYLQSLTGQLVLPTQFIPRQVTIHIIPSDQKQTDKIHFQWKDLQQ